MSTESDSCPAEQQHGLGLGSPGPPRGEESGSLRVQHCLKTHRENGCFKKTIKPYMEFFFFFFWYPTHVLTPFSHETFGVPSYIRAPPHPVSSLSLSPQPPRPPAWATPPKPRARPRPNRTKVGEVMSCWEFWAPGQPNGRMRLTQRATLPS